MGEFLFDEGIYNSISNLKKLADKYSNQIELLNTLLKEITMSSDWEDLSVKTAFLNTLNSYMTVYNTLLAQMNYLVGRLSSKSDAFSNLESTFS